MERGLSNKQLLGSLFFCVAMRWGKRLRIGSFPEKNRQKKALKIFVNP